MLHSKKFAWEQTCNHGNTKLMKKECQVLMQMFFFALNDRLNFEVRVFTKSCTKNRMQELKTLTLICSLPKLITKLVYNYIDVRKYSKE